MSMTSIEWTDCTWNPVRGCSRVSEGCRNCYAERTAARFSGGDIGDDSEDRLHGAFEGFAIMKSDGPHWTGKVELIESKLEEPLHWKKPRRVFVNSMSDLFHEALPDEAIDRVVHVMAWASLHTYQILTKRHERLMEYSQTMAALNPQQRAARIIGSSFGRPVHMDPQDNGGLEWPLPNVWLGVSVEDQKTADERIPLLLQTPAAIRFVSYEPALGPVDFTRWLGGFSETDTQRGITVPRSSGRGIGNRRRGADLEDSGTQGQSMGGDHEPHPVSSEACRESDIEGVSPSSRDVGEKTGPRDGTSVGLYPFSRRNPGRPDYQSPEREGGRQSPAESGTGDLRRADRTFMEAVEKSLPERRGQSSGEAGGICGAGDSPQASERRAFENNSGSIRDLRSDRIENSARRTVGISWLICGGESGPGARPFDIAWARSVRDQCKAAGGGVLHEATGRAPVHSGLRGQLASHQRALAAQQNTVGRITRIYRLVFAERRINGRVARRSTHSRIPGGPLVPLQRTPARV